MPASLALSTAVMLCCQFAFAENRNEFEKFDVTKMTQPVKMDCAQQHSRFLPSISPDGINDTPMVAMQMDGHDMHDHSAHMKMMSQKGYKTSRTDYSVPDVKLFSQSGDEKRIIDVLNNDKPVMLNFIFTTCTTICPVLSASFNQVQEALGEEKGDVVMVSISIDPEYDTVERLSAYAERFDAGSQWEFFTGKLNDVISVEKAFDIYRGSKMNHEPVTLIRVNNDQPWLRIEGLANANDIVSEYRELIVDAD